jgi:hypothetical protein
MKSRIRHLIICLAALLAFNAMASVSENDFDAANKLYEQGKFTEAVGAYEKLIQSGTGSAAVYFNLGDACFKAAQVGRALVAYRQAAQLSPRDQDLRANLQFARNQVSGPTLRISRWQNWLGTLSLNEWTWLTVAAFWLLFLLLAAMQWRPQWRRALRSYVMTAGLLLVIFGSGLGVALAEHQDKLAVVITRDVAVRNGPFEESPSTFTAQDGAEFQILDQKGDWYQVGDGAGRLGWLKRESVAVCPKG